jgi:hypothetical protein
MLFWCQPPRCPLLFPVISSALLGSLVLRAADKCACTAVRMRTWVRLSPRFMHTCIPFMSAHKLSHIAADACVLALVGTSETLCAEDPFWHCVLQVDICGHLQILAACIYILTALALRTLHACKLGEIIQKYNTHCPLFCVIFACML